MMQGEDLKQWRKKMGFTQPELADVLGLSRSQIARLEAGEFAIDKRTALACLCMETARAVTDELQILESGTRKLMEGDIEVSALRTIEIRRFLARVAEITQNSA